MTMPQTKKKPEPTPGPTLPPGENGPGAEVLTLSEAAGYLRLPEAEVLRMVREQDLPARKVGSEWRFLKTAIQDWLRTGPTSLQKNKEAWMALAGAWKDDPYVEEELKEIYRRRGRPMTEDEG
jgi:excisionase family DNA binding protein